MKRIFDKNEHMHTPMSQQHHEYTSHRPTIHLNVQHVYLCNNLISIHTYIDMLETNANFTCDH